MSGDVFILGSCEFAYLVCLGLVAGVLLYVMTTLCSHLESFLSCHLKIVMGPLLWWLVFLGVYLHLSPRFLVFFY